MSTREDLSDTRQDISDKRQDTADKDSVKLRQRIATAIVIICLGCMGGIYFSSHDASVRADTNACAISQFLGTQIVRSNQLKNPGYQEAVKELTGIRVVLRPKPKQCAQILGKPDPLLRTAGK
jgi:hypothetical protein